MADEQQMLEQTTVLRQMFPAFTTVQLMEALRNCGGDLEQSTTLLLSTTPERLEQSARIAQSVREQERLAESLAQSARGPSRPSSFSRSRADRTSISMNPPMAEGIPLSVAQPGIPVAPQMMLPHPPGPPSAVRDPLRVLFGQPSDLHRLLAYELGHIPVADVLQAIYNTDCNLQDALRLLMATHPHPAVEGGEGRPKGRIYQIFNHLPGEYIAEALANTDGDQELAIQLLTAQERQKQEERMREDLVNQLEADYFKALEQMKATGKSQQTTEVELAAAARKRGAVKEIVSQGQGLAYGAAAGGFHGECPSCGYKVLPGSGTSGAAVPERVTDVATRPPSPPRQFEAVAAPSSAL
eukprot:EG_transcript_16014